MRPLIGAGADIRFYGSDPGELRRCPSAAFEFRRGDKFRQMPLPSYGRGQLRQKALRFTPVVSRQEYIDRFPETFFARAGAEQHAPRFHEVVHLEQHFAVFLKEHQIDFRMAEPALKDFLRSPEFLFGNGLVNGFKGNFKAMN